MRHPLEPPADAIAQVRGYGIFQTDPRGTILTWNRGAHEILGWEAGDIIGQPCEILFTPEDRAEGVPQGELERAAAEGFATDDRWHLRHDGSRFWCNGTTNALYDPAGMVTGYVKVVRDRTDAKRAREALEQSEARLRELNETLEERVQERTHALHLSERRFAGAFHAAPFAAYMVSRHERHIIEVNSAFQNLTGYSQAEAAGYSSRDLGLWSQPEEERRLFETALEPGGGFRDLELHLRTRTGDERTVLVSAEPIETEEGSVLLKMFYDITERKRTEEQLLQAVQDAMQDASWFTRALIERLATIRSSQAPPLPQAELTERERQVLALIAQGRTNEEIGSSLTISTQTVRNYVSSIYSKTNVHSRAEAVVWARERGLVGL